MFLCNTRKIRKYFKKKNKISIACTLQKLNTSLYYGSLYPTWNAQNVGRSSQPPPLHSPCVMTINNFLHFLRIVFLIFYLLLFSACPATVASLRKSVGGVRGGDGGERGNYTLFNGRRRRRRRRRSDYRTQ